MLRTEDVLAIHDLINLYGHILDERQFSRAGELFTEDAVYDVSDFGSGIVRGAAAIARMWSEAGDKHPLAHHATNIIVRQGPNGMVQVVSKGMGVRPNGTTSSVLYKDVVTCMPAGWRIAERVATRRRPEAIPAVT